MLIILTFFEYDTTVHWKFEGTQQEYELMSEEVNMYNKWIENLEKGMVPSSSYERSDIGEHYFLATHPGWQNICGRPGERVYYEKWHVRFDILGCNSDKQFKEEYAENYDLGEECSVRDLQNILEKPLGHEEFRMGFKMLPITEKLVKRNIDKHI